MDQIKIGKFIAAQRKRMNLTQIQLAERLGITDRAVSKWETGHAMPDASNMLQLCSILGINVSDLLNGEIVASENYNTATENQLLELVRQKEMHNKLLLRLEWVIGILSTLLLLCPVIVTLLVPMEEWRAVVIVCCGLVPSLAGFAFCTKIEQIAGYYECKHCKHLYVPSYTAIHLAAHMGRTHYMRCPKCGKKSWQKKILTEEETQ